MAKKKKPKNPAAVELGKKRGRAIKKKFENMTQEEQTQFGKKLARARWDKLKPKK